MAKSSTESFCFRGYLITSSVDLIEEINFYIKYGSELDVMELIDDYAHYLESIGFEDGYDTALGNIGYVLGYLNKDEAQNISEFIGVDHPLLGPKFWLLTDEEVFQKGKEWGTAMREGYPYP